MHFIFDWAGTLVQRRPRADFTQVVEDGFPSTHYQAVPGSKIFLRYLKEAGFKMSLASNGFKKETLLGIEQQGFDGFFNQRQGNIFTSDMLMMLGKPAPIMLLTACVNAGVTTLQSAMVGDSDTDMQAAFNAMGVTGIGLVRGRNEEELLRSERELTLCGAKKTVRSYRDLKGWVVANQEHLLGGRPVFSALRNHI